MKFLPDFKYLDEHKGRKVYAGLASAAAFIFSVIFTIALSLLNSIPLAFEAFIYVILATPSAFIAAYISWPKSASRSKLRMALAGISTVALAFLFIGLAIGVFISISDPTGLSAIIAMPFMMIFFGTIFTIGMPYILGISLSLLFATEHGELETDSQL